MLMSRTRSILAVIAAAAACASALAAPDAHAEGKIEARYVATLAGVPVGRGTWTIEVSEDSYTAAATGRTLGLFRVLAGGYGSAAARGLLANGRPVPTNYAVDVNTEKRASIVRMGMNAGVVKDLVAEPPVPPVADRVPVLDAHRRGVLDPMSAVLMAVSGRKDPLTPEACNRTLPIFDGRGRFDLTLSFKRIEEVKAQAGYQGPVLVCTVAFQPISGHRANRSAIKYLTETREMEIWLAPIAGTRILVPYRASVPTILGAAVLEATHFVTSAVAAQPTPSTTKSQ